MDPPHQLLVRHELGDAVRAHDNVPPLCQYVNRGHVALGRQSRAVPAAVPDAPSHGDARKVAARQPHPFWAQELPVDVQRLDLAAPLQDPLPLLDQRRLVVPSQGLDRKGAGPVDYAADDPRVADLGE